MGEYSDKIIGQHSLERCWWLYVLHLMFFVFALPALSVDVVVDNPEQFSREDIE
jgi:hypothetical protein